MKINKKNPKHWQALIVTGLNSLVVIVYRFLGGHKEKRCIILYGHKFNGNLRSFYNYMSENHKNYELYYLTMDADYKKTLPNQVNSLLSTSLKDMLKVAKSSAFFTSHGSHSLVVLNKFTGIKFVDVWHGVSYKGWSKSSFGEQKAYDEVWVSSPSMRDVYINKYGFKSAIVKVTGYSRIDQLINNEIDKEEIVEKYKIPKTNKYVLIAVTWKQDDAGRSIIPFGLTESEFFLGLEELGKKNNALIIFRTHLNSSDAKLDNAGDLKHVHFMPYHKYEVTEEFLALADILVTDWSSIAFDYLPLQRPTIYLDVDSPFKDGFAIGPEYRFGPVVDSLKRLTEEIDKYLNKPANYTYEYKGIIDRSVKIGYGNTMDGKSSERYFKQLEELIN